MNYDVVIIGGLGHVGLPLGLVWADAGLTVGAHDLDAAKKQVVNAGKMPFLEHGAEPILQRVINKKFFVLNDVSEIANAKAVLITIGTPVDEYLTPQLLVITKLADQLIPHLRSGQHIILRSTVFPGTSQRLKEYFENQGLSLHVSFCPERIVQGHSIRELKELPHIVSSYSDEGRQFCAGLFRKLCDKIVEVGVREAELAKLFNNSWRYITFAVANQFYMMSESCGADISEVYRAITQDYVRGQDIPKPGFAAGPCLLKDTMQLSAFYNNVFNLGYAAMQVNEGLPAFCIEHILRNHKLKGMKVGLLGMAFKPEVDDIRDSLSFKLRKLLAYHGAEVLCTDEYVPSDEFFPLETVLEKAELFVVGIPHKRYRTLHFPEGKPVFNIWNLDSASRV
ncbi:MAG: nucleotide sugar dehydrogenase [Verrucomicrobiota bacterium]